MWWWQSVALGGAFSLGGSVPIENFTCWASALVEGARTPAATAPDAAASTCRLVHRGISISSSLKVEQRALLTSGDAARLPVLSSHRNLCAGRTRFPSVNAFSEFPHSYQVMSRRPGCLAATVQVPL